MGNQKSIKGIIVTGTNKALSKNVNASLFEFQQMFLSKRLGRNGYEEALCYLHLILDNELDKEKPSVVKLQKILLFILYSLNEYTKEQFIAVELLVDLRKIEKKYAEFKEKNEKFNNKEIDDLVEEVETILIKIRPELSEEDISAAQKLKEKNDRLHKEIDEKDNEIAKLRKELETFSKNLKRDDKFEDKYKEAITMLPALFSTNNYQSSVINSIGSEWIFENEKDVSKEDLNTISESNFYKKYNISQSEIPMGIMDDFTNNIKLNDINCDLIIQFLDYLQENKNNSISTRNQRLASIHSFYKFIQLRELSCYDIYSQILSIPTKKTPKNTISYFSLNEIEILLNLPNTATKYGFRDYTLLFFMYETGARVSEVSNITREKIYFNDNNNYVIINGKGNKDRKIPLTNNLADILKKYFNSFNIGINDYLFSSKFKIQITRKGIEYILLKYVKQCKNIYKDKFKDKYSCHSMRHSRAMHLLEAKVDLIKIRDFLGHNSIVTTEIYAKVNPTIKQKLISEYSDNLDISEKYTSNEKEELLEFLKQL